MVAVEYRLDADGSSEDWTRVLSTSFLTTDGTRSVAVSTRDVVPRDYILTDGEFSRVPIEPGTWEFFEQQGKIIINADGSIQFTDTGFLYTVGWYASNHRRNATDSAGRGARVPHYRFVVPPAPVSDSGTS